MFRLGQYFLSILSLSPWRLTQSALGDYDNSQDILSMPITEVASNATKSIAIVGSGSAGIAILKALLDLPEDVRQNWDIVLYEQRRNVGGVWLPDPNEPHPPKLPETPLYPLLHTNTPHPTMTYPGSPFRPGTPLFPSHEWVEQYHVDYAEQFGLYPYIHVNHTVHAAGWKGNSTHGQWLVEVHRSQTDGSKQVIRRSFDHLVVANGHNHYPRVPKFNGSEEWLANTPPGRPKREILHSIFYREPERYIGRTVLVIGGGASGRDAVLQVGPLTKTYHSLKEGVDPTPGANVILKPRIAYFNRTSIIFTDGSAVSDVDAIIAATGYKFLVPFLTRSPDDSAATAGLVTSPSTTSNCTTATTLISNERYIFPLWRHIFSISPQHPVTALSFVGLPVLIANCPSDRAQSLLISHAIANPSILEPRSELLADLVAQENRLRDRGYDPYYVGHKMVGGDDDAQEYQNLLVRYLKEKGALPDDGKDFVEEWRKIARKESFLLRRAWKRIEDAGEEDKWLAGIETEDEWADLILRLVDWQKKWEAEHGQTEVDLSPEELWDASGYY